MDFALRELPGDVVVALREMKGYTRSARAFAELVGLSYDTLHRLEMVRWETCADDWERPVDRHDLKAFATAGYVVEGDVIWSRFQMAFVWQHIVLRYGKRIYEPGALKGNLLAPVLEEHIGALVRTIAERETQGIIAAGNTATENQKQRMVEKVTSEVIWTLTVAGLLRPRGDDGPIAADSEQTRAFSDPFTSGAGAENPYTRTLLLAYEWANESLGRLLNEQGE